MIGDFFERFQLLERSARPDGLGGTVESWRDGPDFLGGVAARPGSEARVGGHQALRVASVLVHEPGVCLRQDQRVRRVSDGAVFRVCGDSEDMKTPGRAEVGFAQVGVEAVVYATASSEDNPEGYRRSVASTADRQGWPKSERMKLAHE